uniref:Uncharacterized protein n=1 Tax=Anguilla anguilla TaxID=7936 RepID=A0A0E9TNH9_ANGAN
MHKYILGILLWKISKFVIIAK